MDIKTLFMICVLSCALMACGPRKRTPADNPRLAISHSVPAPGDSTIYGLACPGCTDSVVVLLPDTGGDPVTFDIVRARRAGRVYGTPHTGDWLGIVPSSGDSLRAQLVVNLDELKGTWTNTVLPRLRDVSGLDASQHERLLAQMPDSVVSAYMIPREVGFALKRHSQASPVGMSLREPDEDSPVEYPGVPMVSAWRVYNGRLILVRDEYAEVADSLQVTAVSDTLHFVFLGNDSLALRDKEGVVTGYHRRGSAARIGAE